MRAVQAIKNFFQWVIFKIKNGKIGRWFQNFKATRKAKKALKKLEKIRGSKGKKLDKKGKKLDKKGKKNEESGGEEEEASDETGADPNDFNQNIDDALSIDTSDSGAATPEAEKKTSLKSLKRKLSEITKKKKGHSPEQSRLEESPASAGSEEEKQSEESNSTPKRAGSSFRKRLGSLVRKSGSGSVKIKKGKSGDGASSGTPSRSSSLRKSLKRLSKKVRGDKKTQDKEHLVDDNDSVAEGYSQQSNSAGKQETQFLQIKTRASQPTDGATRSQRVRPHEFGNADASLPASWIPFE